MLPARRISSSNTSNIWNCIRSTVTSVYGLVVTPDFFSGTALGSSLLPVKARFILSLSLNKNDLLKIFIFLYACFLLVKNTRKIYRNPVIDFKIIEHDILTAQKVGFDNFIFFTRFFKLAEQKMVQTIELSVFIFRSSTRYFAQGINFIHSLYLFRYFEYEIIIIVTV
jgi:hypothetical protein